MGPSGKSVLKERRRGKRRGSLLKKVVCENCPKDQDGKSTQFWGKRTRQQKKRKTSCLWTKNTTVPLSSKENRRGKKGTSFWPPKKGSFVEALFQGMKGKSARVKIGTKAPAEWRGSFQKGPSRKGGGKPGRDDT